MKCVLNGMDTLDKSYDMELLQFTMCQNMTR